MYLKHDNNEHLAFSPNYTSQIQLRKKKKISQEY